MKMLKILAVLNLIIFATVFQSQADEPDKAPNTLYQTWDLLGWAPTHKWITEDAVNLLVNKEGVRYVELRAFVRELKEGAIREDDGSVPPHIPFDRTKNHYYNPDTKKGIHASSIGWALGTEKDGDKENNFTFPKALQEYENARLSYSEWESWANFYEIYGAYRCVGNVLHLLQDLSVPWHTTEPLDNWKPGSPHDKYEGYLGANKTNNNHDTYNTFAKLATKVAKPDLFAKYQFDYKKVITEVFHDLALASHGKAYDDEGRFCEIATDLVPKAIEYSAGLMKYFYDYVDAMGWTGMRDRDTHRYGFIEDVNPGDMIKIHTIDGDFVTPKVVARNLDNGVTPWDWLNSAGERCAFQKFLYILYDINGNKKRTGTIWPNEEYDSPLVSQLSIIQNGLDQRFKIRFSINEATCLTVKICNEKGTYTSTFLFNQFKCKGMQEMDWIMPEEGNYVLEISGFDVGGNNFSYKDYISIGKGSISGKASTSKYVSEDSRSGRNYEFYLDVPNINYKIYKWGYNVYENRRSRDDGTYIDYNGNRLVIRVRLDGKWYKKSAKYSANYSIDTKSMEGDVTLAKAIGNIVETSPVSIEKSYPIILLGQDEAGGEGRNLAPNSESRIKIPIMIKDVEEELTTAKIKLSFDPNMVKINDICAPVFEDEGIKVHLQNRIDNQEGRIEIEAVISEEDIDSEKKGTISDNTLFAKALEEENEENIAPIAYLIINVPQRAKSLSPQKSDDFMSFLTIEDAELKDSEENIIAIRIEGKDVAKTKEYEPNLDKVYCYPNPANDRVTFANLTKQIKVKIFNIAGELVYGEQEHMADVNGEWRWDGRNNSGERVSSGIYLYILQDPVGGSIKEGKIGIVR